MGVSHAPQLLLQGDVKMTECAALVLVVLIASFIHSAEGQCSVASSGIAITTSSATIANNAVATFTCVDGYVVSMGNILQLTYTRTCSSTTLDPATPAACTLIMCSTPPTDTNGVYNTLGAYPYQQVVRYTCNSGFYDATTKKDYYEGTCGLTTAKTQGSWSSASSCTAVPCTPPEICDSTSTAISGTTYTAGNTITYTCNTNYVFAPVTSPVNQLTLTCAVSGLVATWTGYNSHACSAILCSTPSAVAQASFTSLGSYPVGTRIQYTCNAGYYNTATKLATFDIDCQKSSTSFTAAWTAAAACTAVPCTPPEICDSTSTAISGTTYTAGNTITYTCKTNYVFTPTTTPTANQLPLTCAVNGLVTSWTGYNSHSCTSIVCSIPSTVAQASFTPLSSYPVGTRIQYTCNSGYYNAATKLATFDIDCQKSSTAFTGVWTAAAACTAVPCTPPIIAGSTSNQASGVVYTHGSTLRYQCNQNKAYFTPTTSLSYQLDLTCNINGQTASWTGYNSHTCTAITCSTPPTNSLATYTALTEYVVDSCVKYTCTSGYYIEATKSNQFQIECKKTTTTATTATWSAAPTCTPIKCPILNIGYSTNNSPSTTVSQGQAVTYTCDTEYIYTPATSPPNVLTATCAVTVSTTTGISTTWTGYNNHVCQKMSCSTPTTIANAQYQSKTSYTIDTEVIYTCNPGYYDGSTKKTTFTITCKAPSSTSSNVGDWIGASTCSKIPCEPQIIKYSTNDMTSGKVYYQGDAIKYTCAGTYIFTPATTTTTPNQLDLTCAVNGYTPTWTGFNGHTCQIVACAVPTIVPNAQYPALSSYPFGTTITYTCNADYYDTTTKQKTFSINCGAPSSTSPNTGQWTPSSTCSRITCSPPFIWYSSDDKTTGKVYYHGDKIKYTCADSYYFSPSTTTANQLELTCFVNGITSTWTGLNAHMCKVMVCGTPPTVNNAAYSTLSSYPLGTKLTYQCNAQYYVPVTMASSFELQCMKSSTGTSGTWPTPTSCIKIPCAPPSIKYSTNDMTSGKVYYHGDAIKYTCAGTYIFSPATATTTPNQLDLTCAVNGHTPTWTGFNGHTCQVVSCAIPTQVANAQYPTLSSYPFGTKITYTCNTDYYETTTKQKTFTINCGAPSSSSSNTGQWTPTSTCSRITCNPPFIWYSSDDKTTGKVYYNGDKIKYTCCDSYVFNPTTPTANQLELTCLVSGITGTWTGLAGHMCTVMLCGTPPTVNNAAYSSLTSYPVGTKLSYQCSPQYYVPVTMANSFEVQCMKSSTGPTGTWTTPAGCTKVPCIPPVIPNSMNDMTTGKVYYNGDRIKYTCASTYAFTPTTSPPSDLELTCSLSSNSPSWTGYNAHTCKAITCPDPPNKSDSTHTSLSSYIVGAEVTYTCNSQYHDALNKMATFKIVCQKATSTTGAWTAGSTCTRVPCTPPLISYADNNIQQGKVYTHGDSITYNCVNNYIFSPTTSSPSTLVLTCSVSGITPTWSGYQAHKCNAIQCTSPPTQSFATVATTLTSYPIGVRVMYTCNTGHYDLNTKLTTYELECKTTSTTIAAWPTNGPTCTLVRCTPPSICFSTNNNPGSTIYTQGVSIRYQCAANYIFSPATTTPNQLDLTCSVSGITSSWTGLNGHTCQPLKCSTPPLKSNAQHTALSAYPIDSRAEYQCNTGFFDSTSVPPSTKFEIKCERSSTYVGTWSAHAGCQAVSCIPPTITNSVNDANTGLYGNGQRIKYTCSANYKFEPSTSPANMLDLTCTTGATTYTWTGLNNHVCKEILCATPPQTISHGVLKSNAATYSIGKVIKYQCDTGYQVSTGNLEAQATCRNVNSLGQWANFETCTDINECQIVPALCDTGCTNTPGSYTCTCNPGYTFDSTTKKCIDINECAVTAALCDHTCTNTPGSYLCTCNTGYSLQSDKKTCADINECAATVSPCAGGSRCINNPGSYTCPCTTSVAYTSTYAPYFQPMVVRFTESYQVVYGGRSASGRQAFCAKWEALALANYRKVISHVKAVHCCSVRASSTEVLHVIEYLQSISEAQKSINGPLAKTSLPSSMTIDGAAVSGTDLFYLSPSETSYPIQDACSSYNLLNTCNNNGVCQVVNGGPVCKCPAGTEGTLCEKYTAPTAKPPLTEGQKIGIGLGVVLGALLLGLLIFLCCYCFNCCGMCNGPQQEPLEKPPVVELPPYRAQAWKGWVPRPRFLTTYPSPQRTEARAYSDAYTTAPYRIYNWASRS